MSALEHQPRLPDLPVRRVQDMGLKELERIRLILRGGSVIEWRRLHFRTRDEVDRFLRLCQIDTTRPHDVEWVNTVLADAVEYLRKTFDYRVAEPVAHPAELHDLFLYASGAKEPKKYRKIACIVLKVMHVIQHIEAKDLYFKIAVSESELAQLVTEKVMAFSEEMKAKGFQLVDFADSIKTRESIITKLLAKKESVAAQIFDRTRFRIIVKERQDILPALYFLTQRLVPFNFIVPGQTQNSLLRFKDLLQDYPHFEKYIRELHLDKDYEDRVEQPGNTFSGSSYRILNFVADVPVRLDSYLPPPEKDDRTRKCRIALPMCEFQICDEVQAQMNEQGENSHERYKQRQRDVVLKRLSRGLVVPRRRAKPAKPSAPKPPRQSAPRPPKPSGPKPAPSRPQAMRPPRSSPPVKK
ncbi:MAG: TIGR04552 family protein [Myxococcaceae bacterium]|nr:TIGR04552 family protein [Myxococcaceae bacterium]